MPRYIDADAFFADFAEIRDYEYASQDYEVDAVEVVRCKDCKHWGIHKWLKMPWCREMHIDRGAEDFCSNAERKEDG